ncbi:MAG: protein TolR [Burkholderiales bacterium]|nr:MAG: protein TolR [Burkholderiales bacterium]
MASSRGRLRRTKNEINMVPFIDVMLVLLIIFMVTAPLISPSQIELPTVGQASAAPKGYVQVVIDKDDQIQVRQGNASRDGRAATLRDLGEQVRSVQSVVSPTETSQVPVVITADKSIRYETVIKVMDTLRRTGIERVGLSVQTGG